jgi:hypothetical protein
MRKAAENGHANVCLELAESMYADLPHAREAGHVGEAAGASTSVGDAEGHDVPPDVLSSVIYWLCKGGMTEQHDVEEELDGYRIRALEGAVFCCNDGCEVVGHLKDFQVCPQCKVFRYCGAACQKED